MREHRFAAPALLALVAVLWSLGGVMIKLVEWNPVAIAGVRSAIAVPVVWMFAGGIKGGFTRVQWAGAIAYIGTVLLFVIATRLTTAANAIFLQYTAPIYVALLAPWWLKEPSRRSDWLAILIALGGIALFFLDRLTVAGLWGNICGLLSGLSFALMVLSLRKDRSGSPIKAVLLGNLLTAAIGLPVVLFSPAPGGNGWLGLLLLGTVQLAIPYVLYTVCIRRVTALDATLITLIEPVLNPLWVMWMLGERPGSWATVGAVLVLASVVVRAVLGAMRAPGLVSRAKAATFT